MSISNSPAPQVRVRTPGGLGLLQKVWRMGDLWMSTVDHAEPQARQDLKLYPIDTLRPAQTGPLGMRPRSHVVRRIVRRPSLLHRFLALLPLTAVIVMVGLAWLAGAQ